MKHLSEEQLVLFHYREDQDRRENVAHLESCPACRRRYEALRMTLGKVDLAPVPERDDTYGSEVWQRLAPRLGATPMISAARRSPLDTERGWWRMFSRRWALVGGLAGLAGAAILAGLVWRYGASPPDEPVRIVSRAMDHPVSFKAIGDHLERSQFALSELIYNKSKGPVDISLEQALAGELLRENRLYCQEASRYEKAGLVSCADTLGDLEHALLEICRCPASLSAEQHRELRRRIDLSNVLFKVRAVSSQVRARESTAVREFVRNGS